MLLKDIEARKLVLEKAESTALKAQRRWKKLAQERAAGEAVNIGRGAEERARAQWEAKRIQALALAKAKAVAVEAKNDADKIKNSTSLIEIDVLTISVNG